MNLKMHRIIVKASLLKCEVKVIDIETNHISHYLPISLINKLSSVAEGRSQ